MLSKYGKSSIKSTSSDILGDRIHKEDLSLTSKSKKKFPTAAPLSQRILNARKKREEALALQQKIIEKEKTESEEKEVQRLKRIEERSVFSFESFEDELKQVRTPLTFSNFTKEVNKPSVKQTVHGSLKSNVYHMMQSNPNLTSKAAKGITLKIREFKDEKKKQRRKDRENKEFNLSSQLKTDRANKLILQEEPSLFIPKDEIVVKKKIRSRKKKEQPIVPLIDTPTFKSRYENKKFRDGLKMHSQTTTQGINELKHVLDFTNFITPTLETLFTKQLVGWGEWLHDFLSMLQFVLSQANTRSSRRAVFRMWLRLQGIHSIESSIASTFMYHAFGDDEKIVTQAVSDEIDKVGDVLEYVFDSAFADSVKHLFISAAMLKWFKHAESRKWIYETFGSFSTKMPVYDLIRICIKSLARIVKVGEDIIAGAPLTEALFKKDPWIHAKVTYDTLMFQKDHLYVGLPKEGKYPRRIWMNQSHNLLTYLQGRKKCTSQLKGKTYLELHSMITAIEASRSEIQSAMNAGMRPTPYAIIIGEDPGIGKSQLLGLICVVMCELKGYTFSHDLIYHVNSNSEFHDGLGEQPFYHYSEPGTSTKKIAETRGDPVMEDLTSVIDGIAKTANMADLSKKGKTFFQPELVIADTNNMGLNLQHMVCNVAAFRRRFRYAKFTVLDKYRKDNSCELDFKKIRNDPPGNPLDLYKIEVWKEEAVSVSKTNLVNNHTDLDINTFVEWLREDMKAHIEGQDYVMALAEDNSMYSAWLPDSQDPSVSSEVSSEDYAATTLKESIIGKIGGKIADAFNLLPTKKSTEDRHVNWVEDDRDVTYTDNVRLLRPFDESRRPTGQERKEDLDAKIDSQVYSYYAGLANTQYTDLSSSDEEKEEFVPMMHGLVTQGSDELRGDVPVWNSLILRDLDSCNMILTIKGLKHRYLRVYECGYVPEFYVRRFVCARFRMPVVLSTDDFVCDSYTEKELFGEEDEVTSDCLYLKVEQPPTPNVHYTILQKMKIFAHQMANSVYWGAAYVCSSSPSAQCVKHNIFGAVGVGLMYGAGIIGNVGLVIYATKLFFSIRHSVTDAKTNFLSSMKKLPNKISTFIIGNREAIFYATLASALGAASIMMLNRQSKKKDEKTIVNSSATDTLDKETGSKPGNKRINIGKFGEEWNIRQSMGQPSVHTGDPIGLSKRISANVRFARWIYTPIGCNPVRLRGYVLGLFGDYVLAPRHYFSKMPEKVTVEISTLRFGEDSPSVTCHVLRKEDVIQVSTDLVVFRMLTSARFTDIMKHIQSDIGASNGKAFIKNCETTAVLKTDNVTVYNIDTKEEYTIGNRFEYSSNLAEGDCGWPLIMQRDVGSSIVAVHVAGRSGNDPKSIANIICRKDIMKAVDILEKHFVQCLSEKPAPTLSATEPIVVDSLEDPIKQSVMCHELMDKVCYLGKLPGAVKAKSVSRLIRNPLFDNQHFEEAFYMAFNTFPTQFYGKPKMCATMVDGKWLSPVNNWYKKINRNVKGLDRKVMRKCIDVFKDRILKGLKDRDVTELSPLLFSEAINGTPSDAYFSRINASTSAGFGLKGSKSAWLPLDEESKDTRVMTKEVEQELLSIISDLDNGVSPHIVYNAALKDEPRLLEKVKNAKTRVFYVSPLAYLILSRKLLGPFYSLMVQHSEVFGTAIGINMHREGGALFKDLDQFSHLFLEGDWGGFDTSMPTDIAMMVATLITEVLRELGYNEKALKLVAALLSEDQSPAISFLQDVIIVLGLQPSGKYGTAENNSLRCLFLLMYYWYSNENLSDKDFFSYLKPVVFGDDVLAAIKEEVSNSFDNCKFAKFAEENYGMEFTNAQKTTDFEPHLTVDKVSFLKRRLHKHPASGVYVAPIEKDSIYKMLQWMIPSKFVSPSEQTAMTIDSALRESFFWLTQDRYEDWRHYLLDCYESVYGMSDDVARHFHTYEHLSHDYFGESWHDFEDVLNARIAEGREPDVDFESSAVVSVPAFNRISQTPPTALDRAWVESKNEWFSNDKEIKEINDVISALETELKELVEELDSIKNPFIGMEHGDARRTELYMSNDDIRAATDTYYRKSGHKRAIELSILHLKSAKQRKLYNDRFVVQSAAEAIPEVGPISTAVEDVEQNLIDVSAEDTAEFGMGTSMSMMTATEFSLDSYLKRPILITSVSIPLNTDYTATIRPWTLLFNNPTTRAKLRNFAYLRADIRLKLVISCSQFEFGTVMAGYVPMPESNTVANWYVSTASAAYRFQKLQYLSQHTGTALMRLHDNKPIELVIPYISYAPIFRLFNIQSTAAIANYEDTDQFGALVIMTLNRVLSVNSTAPTAVSLNVYAHFENIDVGITTGTHSIITTESANEYRTGPIEKVTSAMADASKILADIPIIAPYARASGTVFKALSMLASLYGFSVPAVLPSLNRPSHMRPDAFSNSVTSIGYFTGKKMSLDPQQEITVDPRIVGVEEDELSISAIASKWGLLDSFTWDVTSTPMSTVLWKANVTPSVNFVGPIALTRAFIQPTPLAYAAKPFARWHGSISYKFVINKSFFHKGKIAVIMDPNAIQNALISSVLHLNKQYMLVVDIQETDTFEICVPFSFPRYWANAATETTSNRSMGGTYSATAALGDPESMTGFIAVFPFTGLQGPDATSLNINVFIRSTDISFNEYTTDNLPTVRNVTQSANELRTEPDTCFELGESPLDSRFKVVFNYGEQPVSFRSYLKRYFTSSTSTSLVTIAGGRLMVGFHIFPLIQNDFLTAGGPTTDLMSYLRPSYLALKGTMRKRIHSNKLTQYTMARANIFMYTRNTQVLSNSNSAATGVGSRWHLPCAAFVPNTNGGLEVEIPFYNTNLFLPSGINSPFETITSTTYDNANVVYYGAEFEAGAGDTQYVIEESSIGEDFTLSHFLGATPYSTTSW